MKKTILTLVIMAVMIALGVMLCVPLIDSYQPEQTYYSTGYANAKGIMRGLCLGSTEESYGVVYRERAVPGLAEKLDDYCELVDGRLYQHIATADFVLEGDYPNVPWSETSYVEIRMEDGTMLYAVVIYLQDVDGCGVTDFDLYTECPW